MVRLGRAYGCTVRIPAGAGYQEARQVAALIADGLGFGVCLLACDRAGIVRKSTLVSPDELAA